MTRDNNLLGKFHLELLEYRLEFALQAVDGARDAAGAFILALGFELLLFILADVARGFNRTSHAVTRVSTSLREGVAISLGNESVVILNGDLGASRKILGGENEHDGANVDAVRVRGARVVHETWKRPYAA